MNDIESRLRSAFEAEASNVTEESLRPAEPPSVSTDGAPASRWDAGAHNRWVWPAAAAVAVVAVTVGVSVLHDQETTVPGPADRGTPPVHTPSPKPPPSTTPAHLSEQGRHYDVVNVFGSNGRPGAGLVLYVHRWRVFGHLGKLIPDRQIAEHGWQPVAHQDQVETDLSKAPYDIPVPAGATFTLNICKPKDKTMEPKLVPQRVSATKFLHSPSRVAVVVKLDRQGRLVWAQTDGGC